MSGNHVVRLGAEVSAETLAIVLSDRLRACHA